MGVSSYGAVGWAYYGIHLKTQSDNKFRREIENLESSIFQQKA